MAAAGILAARFISSNFVLSLLAQASFSAIFSLGVGFLIRQNGMVSFGHATFFSLPCYAIAALAPLRIMPFELLVFVSIIGTGAFAFLVGLTIVRVHGIAFGMLTLAIGQGVYEAATRLRGITGGHDGMSLRLPREIFGLSVKTFQQPQGMFIISWLLLTLLLLLVWIFAESRHGRLTQGIRDNEERVRFLGYKTLVPRALVFALSGGIVAVGGVLFVLYNGFISPDSLHWTASGSALIMAILGGASSIGGPILGAFAYFFLKHAAGAYTTHWLSIIGVAVILVAVAFPTGLAGLIKKVFSRKKTEAVG